MLNVEYNPLYASIQVKNAYSVYIYIDFVLRKQKVHRILRDSLFDRATRKINKFGGNIMKWEKPEYTDLRFGFEVTMYIYNR